MEILAPNKHWSTVCDKSYFRSGWPSIFCRSLGFNEAKSAIPARDTVVGVGEGHIALHNIDCMAVKNPTWEACARSVSGFNCGHHDDVAVKCIPTQ